MKKKILLGLVTVLIVSGGVAAMSAFEAHVINVTAKIENALSVSTKHIDFGTVFPQEKLIENIWIRLSSSFLEEERVDDVKYEIHQKTKFKVFPKADVLFAFDTTGSMSGAIDNAKADAIAIMDTLKTLIPDAGFGVVKFEDYPISPYGMSGDTAYLLTQPITTDTGTVATAIDVLTLGHGGDGPQSYTRVMYESYTDTNIDWRSGAQQILIILGDNVPHDDNLTQDPFYGLAPWGTPNPWVTGYPTSYLDPGPDGTPNTADDLDFQPTLKAMTDNSIILYYLDYGAYATKWDWWCSKTGGSAVAASDYDDLPEAIKGLFAYKNLCPYLSKLKKTEDPDDYHPDIGVPSPHDPGLIAYGYMSKKMGDIEDGWDIDLVVPCFEGMCDQTYDPAVYGPPLDPRLESQEFGCDLWIEVTDISRVQTLRLENKDPDDWSVIVDGRYGTLVYNDSGPIFSYSLTAQGLNPDTNYSLIYYADPWAGDNPGAFIGSGTTNGTGDLTFSGSPDLGMDLPDPADANYPDGAKIWLVLSSGYNSGSNSMTAWKPTEYLFEYNLITYDDTDI